VGKRADACDEESGQDEVGRIRDRRERVGREDGETRDAGQTLVMRQVRRDGLADEETL